MADQDFKYIIQDLTNIYLGARSTYEELMEDENVPHKLKEIIVRVMLTEVAPDTTPENHVFYMEKDSASFKAYKKMKARFKMSVWETADGKKRKKSGYVNREYSVEEIVGSKELHEKKDTIIVEEVHISKLGLGALLCEGAALPPRQVPPLPSLGFRFPCQGILYSGCLCFPACLCIICVDGCRQKKGLFLTVLYPCSSANAAETPPFGRQT